MSGKFPDGDTKHSDKLKRNLKTTIKDSVFRSLFQDPKYTLQLYQALHPEDNDVTVDEISNITINNVMLNDLYNDCSFVVRDRFFIMVECQSSWSINIVVRQLMYYANNLHRYILKTKQNPYTSRKLKIPAPEFYVVFSGDKADTPEWISLSDEFFDGKSGYLDLRARVVTGGRDDIISQFIDFTAILDEQRLKLGKKEQTIHETIRICKARNILVDYLNEREEEVVSMLMALYDNDTLLRAYEHELLQEGLSKGLSEGLAEGREAGLAEGREAGLAEGREAGLAEGQRKAVVSMWKKGFSVEDISGVLEIDEEKVAEWVCQPVAR